MRTVSVELPAGSGRWIVHNLSCRGRTHVSRGHVPPVQSGQANTAVNSAANTEAASASALAERVFFPVLWSCLMPGRSAIRGADVDRRGKELWSGWDGVVTAAVTLVGP